MDSGPLLRLEPTEESGGRKLTKAERRAPAPAACPLCVRSVSALRPLCVRSRPEAVLGGAARAHARCMSALRPFYVRSASALRPFLFAAYPVCVRFGLLFVI